jgi:hypothetical protein
MKSSNMEYEQAMAIITERVDAMLDDVRSFKTIIIDNEEVKMPIREYRELKRI